MIISDAASTILLCLTAGIHAASYGAFKDSPHESFIKRRFIRELVFSLLIGMVFSYMEIWRTENFFIIYISTFTLCRFVTEFWKLFIRVEPQDNFRIPTQVHFIRNVVHNRSLRLLIGFFAVGIVYSVYLLSANLPDSLTMQQKGVIVGLSIGLADALGGAYKDGLMEGFYLRKFLKSPTLGIIGGFIVSFLSTDPLFHLFGTIAIMRMLIELFFKIFVAAYVPGKFPSMEPVYPEWSKKRKVFLVPYSFTWIVFIILMIQ